MQITIRNAETGGKVPLRLSNERRSLANFLSILDAEKIDEMEICDLAESKFPKNIRRFKALRRLSLVRCHAITSFPPELSPCPALEELALIKCADFCDLRGVAELGRLRVLHVSGCSTFDGLPDEISRMTNLRALDLSYSDGIRWLDASILPEGLKILDMHGCWQCDFSDADAAPLRLVSLQIQDLSRLDDLDAAPVVPDLCTQLRRTMTLRDGCGLDA